MPETLIRLYVGGTPAACRGCGAAIEWFKTLKGKSMPMNLGATPRRVTGDASGRAVGFYSSADAHWSTCPKANLFSRGTAP